MSLLRYVRCSNTFAPFAAALLALTTPLASHAAEGDLYESAVVGTKVAFSVTADGNPVPTFQWTKNGTAISGATNATLTLPSVTTADSAVYNAVATNSAGWALSNDLILTINTTNVAPSFTLQPFPSATSPEGAALTLSATAVGTPTPSYQWRKNGTALTGATNSTLSFSALKLADSGTYSVIATNLAGSATSINSVLTVVASSLTSAPVITTQPASQTVARKGTVLFTVAASGSPTPTYQWYRNGTPIAGETNSSYAIKTVSPSQAGTYTAVATNSAGSATSQGAVLTVSNR